MADPMPCGSAFGRGTTARELCHCPDSACVSLVTSPNELGCSTGTGYWHSQIPFSISASRQASMTLLRLAYQLLVKGFSASFVTGCTVRCTLSKYLASSVMFSD